MIIQQWLPAMQQQQPDTVTHSRISSLLISRCLSRPRVALAILNNSLAIATTRSWLSPRRALLFISWFKAIGPVVEKAKTAFIIQNQLMMTRGILFHKGQPCPTSSAALSYWKRRKAGHGLGTRLLFVLHQTSTYNTALTTTPICKA